MWEKKFERAELRFEENGCFQLSLDDFSLKENKIQISYAGTEAVIHWERLADEEKSIRFQGTEERGDWTLEFYAGREGELFLKFYGTLRQIEPQLTIVLLNFRDLEATHLLGQGISMGGCTSLLFPLKEEKTFTSYYQTMITRNGKTLQIAFPLSEKQILKANGTACGDRLRECSVNTEISFYDGLSIELDPVQIRVSGNPFAMMTEWADAQPAPEAIPEPVPGWNSWDYYRWTITEQEVLENAEFIARDPVLSKHVKRIIVDDGWEYCYGEWDANSLFPSGMEYLGKELTRMGFEPGLWIAPSIVEPHARIAQLEYDMLACGDNGYPCLCYECMRRVGFVLDPTRIKVQKHLFDLFSRYAKMGFRHFKLDFLAATLKASQFADRLVPRSRIMEKLLTPIREATKGHAQLLGCNYQYLGGTGLVDAVRVGGDIHATWRGITENVISVAARFWANKKLWLNDPDFSLCRSLDTADDPDLTRLLCLLVFNMPHDKEVNDCNGVLVDIYHPQSELLLSLVLMAAGAVNLSDKMTRLNPAGVELARRVVSAESGDPGIPLDLFRSERPSYWIQKLKRGYRVLLINWSEESALRELDLTPFGITASSAVNFWNDETVLLKHNCFRAELAPRSCLLGVFEH